MTDPSTAPDPDVPSSGATAAGQGGPQPEGARPPGGYAPPPSGGYPPPPPGGYAPPPPGGYPPPPPGGYAPPPGGYGPPPGGYPAPPPGGYPPPQPGGYAPQGSYQQAPVSRSDETTWAMVAHFLAIVGFFLPGLIVYLVFKDRSGYLNAQGKEALNWGITTSIIEVGVYVLAALSFGLLGFLPALSFVLRLVFGLIAGFAVKDHADYRYPFAIRLVK